MKKKKIKKKYKRFFKEFADRKTIDELLQSCTEIDSCEIYFHVVVWRLHDRLFVKNEINVVCMNTQKYLHCLQLFMFDWNAI